MERTAIGPRTPASDLSFSADYNFKFVSFISMHNLEILPLSHSYIDCWYFLLSPEVIRQHAKLLSIRSTSSVDLLLRICKITNTLESNLEDGRAE